ncbi:MAG: methyltransferase domain-containing protein [Oligoflexales bacterium]|nr:methyltransferase domain-containing protein [Oligoflexales bacterium]
MNSELWKKFWDEGSTPWNLGRAHPFLKLIVEKVENISAKNINESSILVPGCGHAHDGAALAEMGAKTVAFDVVGTAINQAKALYGHRENLQLLVEDALNLPNSWNESFSAVFDRAMLCALAPKDRSVYLKSCYNALQDGGIFFGPLFSEVQVLQGPPFALTLEQLLELFSENFSLLFIEQVFCTEKTGPIKQEWLVAWRKKFKRLGTIL